MWGDEPTGSPSRIEEVTSSILSVVVVLERNNVSQRATGIDITLDVTASSYIDMINDMIVSYRAHWVIMYTGYLYRFRETTECKCMIIIDLLKMYILNSGCVLLLFSN